MEHNNTTSTPSNNTRYYHILLLLIVVLAAGIRLSAINRTVRWDEGRNLQQFAQRLPVEFLFDFSDTNNHFLNSLMMHIQYRILGNDDDWKIRVHVFIVGLLVIIATFHAGKELYDADVGLMAAALSSVLYLLVEFSINARGYIIITLIYLLMIILINRMIKQSNRRGWIGIGVLSALGFYVSPIFLYSMGTLGVWMVLSILFENRGNQRRRNFTYFAGSMVLGALLTVMYYIPLFMRSYGSSTEFSDSYVYRLTQPLENRDFLTETIPQVAQTVIELVHTGMTLPIIAMTLTGLVIAIVFHCKIGTNRIPLPPAIVVWLTAQILIQQSYIVERSFTFLMPIYAILVAAGLIALVRFLTLRRIPRLPIAITLSLIMTLSIGYELVRNNTLFNAWITASMPYGGDVADLLPEILDEDDTVMLQARYVAVLNYYFKRDGIDVTMFAIDRRDNALLENWELGESRYLIDGDYLRFSDIMEDHSIALPDQNFVFEPVMELTDNYYLFEVTRTQPEIKAIIDAEQVELFWYVGNQSVSYKLDEAQMLTFVLDGDTWKNFHYRYGDFWQDYRLSARIKIEEPSYDFEDLLIQFRNTDDSHYSLGLKVSSESGDGFLGLRLDFNGDLLGYFATTTVPLELNQWYDIAIDVDGDTFTIFIDDEQMLQANDLVLQQGAIGFLAPPDSTIQITDISLD